MWPVAARRVRAAPRRSLRTRSAARKVARGGRLPVGEGQVQVALGADEGERDRLGGPGGAVLDGEHELLAVTAQREGGIDPGEEGAGAAPGPAAGGGGAVLARAWRGGGGPVRDVGVEAATGKGATG